ncbi:hypothetical protein CFAM422_012273 [Trichoderma lentiforme]|uniref:NACHT-NTPase and P-loop NTPases N-terminal domain-containing protein n=1 Tax=Trichoderma lentiforme TaxID=1567552 RepID=A0A9P4X463_9HYPO|nr:hypothetical protein CFAM422_012273 [Trichoderma lentiforme]
MTDTNATISEITTLVAEDMTHYETVKEDHTLGNTFHETGRRLGLIKEVLGYFQTQQPTDTAQAPTSADTLLRDCHNDAILSKNLFKQVSQVSPTRLQLYKDFLTANGGHNLVENLVLNLMQNICCLAKYYGVDEEMLKGLRVAINELKGMKSSDPNMQNEAVHSYFNSGSGPQFNASTLSTQNISTGSGTNFTGSNFHGTFIFGKV